jgi:hypothetical protein
VSIDEVSKLIFIISISFGVLAITFQLARILGKTADILQDLRHSIKNLGSFSDQLLEDYKVLSEALKGITSFLLHFNDNVLSPIKTFTGFFGRFRGKKNDIEDDPEEL